MNKKIVLTGAGGFLGSHLLPKLVAEGATVVAVSYKGYDDARIMQVAGEAIAAGSVRIVQSDDGAALRTGLEGADVLLNGAFPRNTDGTQMAEGLDFLAGLFHMAAEVGVGAVANISSQSVYSQHRESAATEATPLCLETAYAVGKYAVELLLDAHCSDVPHTNVRLASMIGPGFDQRVVNKMVRRALAEGVIEVADNGSRFGYLDVEDATDALVLLPGSDPARWEHAYNLGPDAEVTLMQIGEAVQEALAARGVPVKLRHLEPAAGRPAVSSPVDSARFKALTGWSSRMTLADSVEAIVGFAMSGS